MKSAATTPTAEPRLLTAKEAANMLSISTRKLWSLSNRREVPVVRIGGSVRYSVDDLHAYIQKHRVATWR